MQSTPYWLLDELKITYQQVCCRLDGQWGRKLLQKRYLSGSHSGIRPENTFKSETFELDDCLTIDRKS